MNDTPPEDRQRRSNAFGRERDAQIVWLLARHPATADMLVRVGFFRTRTRAARRLRRLVERGRLRLVGTVPLGEGRPEHAYATTPVKIDNVLHEVELSRVCFRIFADEMRRGPGEVDPDLRPDAEFLINGRRFFLELDRGTTSYQTIEQTRFAKYQHVDDLVLWVCPTAERMEGLRRRAGVLRGTALFTTLDRALRDPHAAIWVDADGERAALPRAGRTDG